MSDNYSYEKTILFGGLIYSPITEDSGPISHLSSEVYAIELNQIIS